MAEKLFLVDLNLNGNQLKGVVVEKLETAPSSPVEGQIYYNTTTKKFMYYNGTSWIAGSEYAAQSMAADDTETNQYAIYDSTTGSTFKFRAIKAASGKIKLSMSEGVISIDAAITKSNVGLGNVDNTSDANKPVSSAQATAIADAKKAGTDAQDAVDALSETVNDPTTGLAATKAIADKNKTDISTLNGTGEGSVSKSISDAIDSLALGTASKADTGIAEGNVPVLGANGKLNENVIPSLAIMDTKVVATHAEMLELTDVQKGDICIVTDESKTYILAQEPASEDDNWKQILTPAADVTKAYVDAQDAATIATIKGTGLDDAYNTLAKIEAIIKANKTAADKTQTDLTALTGRVQTAEGEIDTLQGYVGTDATNGLGKKIADNTAAIGTKTNKYVASATTGQSLSIPATTHKCGTTPIVQAYYKGSLAVIAVAVAENGDITASWNVALSDSDTIKIIVIGI